MTSPPHSLHFIGVLTPEMASLASYALKSGASASGSDDHRDSLYLSSLLAAGLRFCDTFNQHNIASTTQGVVISRYYDARHPEYLAAAKAKIPLMTEAEYGRQITQNSRRVAVLGEYEGPLVATWLHHVWRQAHVSVQALTHSVTESDDGLAYPSESEWFVVPFSGFKRDATVYEADFLSADAEIVIMPSIRYDYPEIYMTLDDVYHAYYTFARRVPRRGLIVGDSDYARMKRLRTHLVDRHIETYGFDRDAGWQIRDVEESANEASFSLLKGNQLYGPFTIPCHGRCFIAAAAAVSVVSLMLELSPAIIARGLATVPRLKRFGSTYTDREGRVIIDDRADHPETIEAILTYCRQTYPSKKIWCLYQPGSFLRTKAENDGLQKALGLADNIFIADIKGYPKEKSEGLHARHFVAEFRRKHPTTYYLEPESDVSRLLSDRVPRDDCIVILGADGLFDRAARPLIRSVASQPAGLSS